MSPSTGSTTATTPRRFTRSALCWRPRSVHTGRSAFYHLLALAQTHGIGKKRVDELIDLVGLHDVARKRAGKFSLGMGQRLGIATALLGDPHTLLLDEPVNGLDPEGIHWIRNLLKALAAEGRAVFVSSHLMSEMALTADHLIVVGRGKLIADTNVDEFVRRASGATVRVRSPQAAKLGDLVRAEGVSVASMEPGVLEIAGTDDRSRRRDRRRERDRSPRADADTGVTRGGVHGAHPRRRRVQSGTWRHERSGASDPRPREDRPRHRRPVCWCRSGRSFTRCARRGGRCSSQSCSRSGCPRSSRR